MSNKINPIPSIIQFNTEGVLCFGRVGKWNLYYTKTIDTIRTEQLEVTCQQMDIDDFSFWDQL